VRWGRLGRVLGGGKGGDLEDVKEHNNTGKRKNPNRKFKSSKKIDKDVEDDFKWWEPLGQSNEGHVVTRVSFSGVW
jgi:hypothetical protein